MALIFVISMAAIGTALTALRLWKTVSVWRLHARGEHGQRWHSEVTLFALLSHLELCAIAVSANLPTLTGWWRRRRTTTKTTTAQRSRSGATGSGSGGSKGGRGRASGVSRLVKKGHAATATATATTTTTAQDPNDYNDIMRGGDGRRTGGEGAEEGRVDGISASYAIRLKTTRKTAPTAPATSGGRQGASRAGFSMLASPSWTPSTTVTDAAHDEDTDNDDDGDTKDLEDGAGTAVTAGSVAASAASHTGSADMIVPKAVA